MRVVVMGAALLVAALLVFVLEGWLTQRILNDVFGLSLSLRDGVLLAFLVNVLANSLGRSSR